MTRSILSFLFIILLSQTILSQQLDHNYFKDNVEVYFKFRFISKTELNDLSRIISIDNVLGDTAYAYANEEEYYNFIKSGYQIEILTSPGKIIHPAMSDNILEISDWNVYPTYDAYVSLMSQFAAQYPDICQLVNAGSTVQGRQILFVKISDNVAQREVEPQFMFSSSMHGDETTGYVLMLRLIDTLLTSYGSDTRLTNLINNTEIWINPLGNPDGTYHGGNGTVYGATRYNANGVDLNRNFPDPAEGPHPDGHAWQPETITMKTLAENNNFILSCNFHGGAEVVNYPWDTWSRLHPDDSWFQLISHLYADTAQANSPAGYMDGFNDGITNGYDWYRVTGGRQDFFTYFHHGREVTIEISNTKLLNPSLLPAYWYYNKESFLDYMENTSYGIRGIVTDTSGIPVKAKIEIASHDFDNSEIYSDSVTGAYFRMISGGTYTLTFSADNYITQTITGVQAVNFQSTELNIQLVPDPTPVELSSFTAGIEAGGIQLNWSTSSEINNKGFDIERSQILKDKNRMDWIKIGYVEGNGTTAESHFYSLIDNSINKGIYLYRLKQIDFNGTFNYSGIVQAEIVSPSVFALEQNFPNPFNPSTLIQYQIPDKEFVRLSIYDILGNEIATLINEEKNAGNYTVRFDGNKLSSGLYFYTINAGNYRASKKMLLLK
ncbi:MAG TPA: M14 family zinc carboxypeptidase [Ignavibacteriaceae bacterium]|nr:M14 family zinc carboxypeptidase [Ignavibacteriaceae bacterium]